MFPSFARRYVTLERCVIPRRISQAPRRLTFFSEPNPRRILALSLWLDFPPLRRWQAPRTLHKLHEGEAHACSQSSTKRSPGYQPSQLGGHPPRVTSSRYLTRTNRGGGTWPSCIDPLSISIRRFLCGWQTPLVLLNAILPGR